MKQPEGSACSIPGTAHLWRQTATKTSKAEGKNGRQKPFLLPLLLPTPLPSKKPWEVGLSEQTLMCFGGEKLHRGAGNATVEQVTPAELLTCTQKPGILTL